MLEVKTAVFPVAGLGTRFLPATKANPKEMLPIVDKPLIQYAVEEAIRAGIEHIIFVTSSSKRAIEDHFDINYELEARLFEKQKYDLLDSLRSISPTKVKYTYIRQNQPLGLGHALLCAKHVVANQPFAVLLADDLIIDHDFPCLADMKENFTQNGGSIVAVQNVPWDSVHQYGVVNTNNSDAAYSKILDVVEKPQKEEATSNLVAIGRYIFTPGLFDCLENVKPDSRGEVQIADAIVTLLNKEEVFAYKFLGKRFDCGSKIGYLQATVEMGMQHSEVGDSFTQYLYSSLELSNNLGFIDPGSRSESVLDA